MPAADLNSSAASWLGVPVPVDQFIKSLPGQKLMAVRPGQFAVLVQERPVTNEKGSPIIIKVN